MQFEPTDLFKIEQGTTYEILFLLVGDKKND